MHLSNAVICEDFKRSFNEGLEGKLTFSSPVATVELSKFADILSATLSKHHLPGFEIAQLESITSTSFAHSDVF